MGVTVEGMGFDAAADQIVQAVVRGVRITAYQIETRAKLDAAVDTGFMRGSIFVENFEPTKTQVQSDVGVGAEYGIYVDMGTHKMPAQPFFTPAVERGRADLSGNIAEQVAGVRG